MSSVVNVAIHASQFPDAVRRDLLTSLRTRRVNHKFHYDSVKQTQKWLRLHQAYSPSRTDSGCLAAYEQGFASALTGLADDRVHVIGLGCGGGQKDTRLLRQLTSFGKETCYTPCDVSTAMVLVARQAALAVLPPENIFPLVCDLASADDLPGVLKQHGLQAAARLITFFGMIPNFEPRSILSKLAALIRPEDLLLFSANLAPGSDYAAGVQQIMPQYDNALTHDWLLTFLFDLGVSPAAGELRFVVEENPAGSGLKRVAGHFHFAAATEVQIEDELIAFRAGEILRLFFSYRYTPQLVSRLLGAHGLEVRQQWLTDSQEEGVFLCRRP
jgi:uncharacterized SAM-dependent methyltransferase